MNRFQAISAFAKLAFLKLGKKAVVKKTHSTYRFANGETEVVDWAVNLPFEISGYSGTLTVDRLSYVPGRVTPILIGI